jgi:poly(3-hydroxyalkanoate) depolymerase
MRIYSDNVGNFRIRIVSTLDEYEGTPLLIFNGIGASLEILEPVLKALELPAIAFDMPGTGGSPARFVGLRMARFADIGLALLDKLGITTANIMGVSWGGGVAQEFARRHGNRTGKLILAATSMGQVMVPPGPRVMLHMASPLRYLSSAYFRNVASIIYGGDFRKDPGLARKHASKMSPPNSMGYLQQLAAIGGWTSAFWLHKIPHETLVLAGTDDPIIPLINARMIANRIPNARLETFDCGHLFILTRREQAVGSIEQFLLS